MESYPYGSGNYSDFGNAIGQDSIGNIYVSGGTNVGGYNNICTIKYGASTSTEVLKNPAVQEINMYPNPATDFFIIAPIEQKASMKIFDINGKELYYTALSPNIQNIIGTSFLNDGIYLIQISNLGHITSKKLLIARN